MFGSIGLPELLVLAVILLISLVWLLPAWRIVGKTGNSGALSLLFFIPFVNIGMLLFLAFSEWPIERELKAHRQRQQA